MDSQARLLMKTLLIGILIGFILGKILYIKVDIHPGLKRTFSGSKIAQTEQKRARVEPVGKDMAKGDLELCYFERGADIKKVEKGNTNVEISDEQASQDRYSLKSIFPDGGGAIGFYETLPRNWTGYETFKFDVYSEEDGIPLSLFVKDSKNKSYGERYNRERIPLQKGWNNIEIPISALDSKLMMNDIRHLRIFLWQVPGEHTLYFDNIRLTRG